MGRPRSRVKISNVAIAAASVALALAVVEIGLRIAGAGPPAEARRGRLEAVEGGQIHCPDPRVTRPYFERRPRHPGCVFYPRNNLATRNLFDVAPDAERVLRIVALGDSMVFGYGVDHEDTFLHRLQQTLEARFEPEPVEVINAGRPGFDLEDAFELLREKVLPIRPDSVLLGVHPNDFLEFSPAPGHRSADAGVRRHLQLVDLLLHRWELTRTGERNLARALESYDAPAREVLFSRLRAFRDTLAEREIPLLVLLFPVLFDLDDHPFRGIHADLSAFLTREGIEHLDLLPPFLDRDARAYWITRTDQHPNERAHRIFYEQLIAYLDARPGGPAGRLRAALGPGRARVAE